MAGWERIEAMARDRELSGGLEARIADPLWLLARQWQVGEFQGDDAAQPVVARVAWRSLPLASYRAGTPEAGTPVPLPAGRPLEALAEATSESDLGVGGLHASARAGRRLRRLLTGAGLGAGAEALEAAFRLVVPAHQVAAGGLGRVSADLLARRGLNGTSVAAAGPARTGQVLAGRLAGDDLARANSVVNDWRAWYRARGGAGASPVGVAWDAERVGYRFSIAAAGPRGEVTLLAPDHDGGHLDWYSFDLAGPDQAHGLGTGQVPERSRAVVPTPVRYAGMPASRFWEFEDGQVHFGDLAAGPADLARLLVAELATTYGDDMFVLPLPVPAGSLTELGRLEVLDSFGERTPVPSAAAADAPAGDRVWRLFELRGDEVDERHRSPWLLIPPTLAGSQEGAALELVALARDGAANLAWGIEHLVEGPLGRAVDRSEAWASGRRRRPPPTGQPAGPDEAWRYRLEATAPPWWVPLVAERIDPGAVGGEAAAQVRLRRARMQAWALLADGDLRDHIGARSVFLDPRRPRWLAEARVPASGLRVERGWQLARWHDGSLHTWLRHRVTPGRGEAASGVRWDLLDRPGPDAAQPPAPR